MVEIEKLMEISSEVINCGSFERGDLVTFKNNIAHAYDLPRGAVGVISYSYNDGVAKCDVDVLDSYGKAKTFCVECWKIQPYKKPQVDLSVPKYKRGDVVSLKNINIEGADYPVETYGVVLNPIDNSSMYAVRLGYEALVGETVCRRGEIFTIDSTDINHNSTAMLEISCDNTPQSVVDVNSIPEIFTEYGYDPDHPWGVSFGDIVKIEFIDDKYDSVDYFYGVVSDINPTSVTYSFKIISDSGHSFWVSDPNTVAILEHDFLTKGIQRNMR